nr:hypothetical protein CFP56_00542 [Quercus suber]
MPGRNIGRTVLAISTSHSRQFATSSSVANAGLLQERPVLTLCSFHAQNLSSPVPPLFPTTFELLTSLLLLLDVSESATHLSSYSISHTGYFARHLLRDPINFQRPCELIVLVIAVFCDTDEPRLRTTFVETVEAAVDKSLIFKTLQLSLGLLYRIILSIVGAVFPIRLFVKEHKNSRPFGNNSERSLTTLVPDVFHDEVSPNQGKHIVWAARKLQIEVKDYGNLSIPEGRVFLSGRRALPSLSPHLWSSWSSILLGHPDSHLSRASERLSSLSAYGSPAVFVYRLLFRAKICSSLRYCILPGMQIAQIGISSVLPNIVFTDVMKVAYKAIASLIYRCVTSIACCRPFYQRHEHVAMLDADVDGSCARSQTNREGEPVRRLEISISISKT